MRTFVFLVLLFTTICSKAFSEEIEKIIENIKVNNPQLQEIREKLGIYKYKKEFETSLPDFNLDISINDIQLFYRPLDRNIEPMQSIGVGISRKIPYLEKLKTKGEIVDKELSTEKINLIKIQQEVLEKAYLSIYKIWLIQRKLNLIGHYKDIAKSIISLSNVSYSVGKASQSDILNAQVYYTFLKKKENTLKKTLEKEKIKIYSLAGRKIKIGNISIKEEKKKKLKEYLSKIRNSPEYLIMSQKIKTQKEKEKFAKLSFYPDFKLFIKYFYRKSFNDYISAGVSFPLTFLNKEKYISKIKLEKKKTAVYEKKLKTVEEKLKEDIQTNYQTIEEVEENLKILKLMKEQIIETYRAVLSEFKVGKRNMVDVLSVLKQLIYTEEQILDETYKKHASIIKIKADVGELR